jgi:hypothetical protein
MTSYSLIHNRARLEGFASGPNGGPTNGSRLRLLPSGDGWSLVGTDGQLVFSAFGHSARQRGLQFAQAEGVLALIR